MQRTARSGQSCLLLAADRTPTALFGTVYETVGLATRGFTSTRVVPFLVPNANHRTRAAPLTHSGKHAPAVAEHAKSRGVSTARTPLPAA